MDESMTKVLQAALFGLKWDRDTGVFALRVAAELTRMGYTIVKVDR